MPHFSSDKYQIEIESDPTYRFGSADNVNDYETIHFPESKYRLSSVYGIKIFKDEVLLKGAVIGADGGSTGIFENSLIIEPDRIIICCSNSVFCLSIPDLNLLWKTKVDGITCFEIFKHLDNYIIHGEMEISMLDKNGIILWQQSGRDIFVAQTNDGFIVTENYILVKDWENNQYKFDFTGQIIT
ncbi:hypothetical protein CNR22_09055 [Sphingobacteriaceae bacterium]|nr:hypothetical protein CNR22_09055 [Sphingobacteriaceae bacterium]